MKIYVVDASFIVAALTGDFPGAISRFEKIVHEVKSGKADLYSGTILPIETANALRYKIPTFSEVTELFQRFSLVPIKYFDLEPSKILEIINLSLQLKSSVYDASYHFVAKSLEGTLLTCDKKYFLKAKGLGGIELVC